MRKNFSIADGMKILDIGRDQLFYWIKTKRLIIPEIEGKGRGARSKLSIINILELAVIKELSILGIELNCIEEILKINVGIDFNEEGKRLKKPIRFTRFLQYIYNKYCKGRGEKHHHYHILIYKGKYSRYDIMPRENIAGMFIKEIINPEHYVVLIADLFEILRKVEEKIGENI